MFENRSLVPCGERAERELMEASDQSISIKARPLGFELEPPRTAVIVVDMQNDFASSDGAFARAGQDISSIQGIVAPISRVLIAARLAHITVVYLKMEF